MTKRLFVEKYLTGNSSQPFQVKCGDDEETWVIASGFSTQADAWNCAKVLARPYGY